VTLANQMRQIDPDAIQFKQESRMVNHRRISSYGIVTAFVILVLYGRLGWALFAFIVAGITDGLDGLIARRSGQHTQLGAWLDPMADKLLLVTTFVVLTLPGLGLANRLPLWLTVLVISRDVLIVRTVTIINLAVGALEPDLGGVGGLDLQAGIADLERTRRVMSPMSEQLERGRRPLDPLHRRAGNHP
jgi:phosphatidylglycerophosphate synthase